VGVPIFDRGKRTAHSSEKNFGHCFFSLAVFSGSTVVTPMSQLGRFVFAAGQDLMNKWRYRDSMNRETILQEAKDELERHVWGTFVEGDMSVALGGTGVVVSGCEACRKRFGTNSQYLRHLADDVLPGRLMDVSL
jgi:hypothetical protein